MEQQGVSLKRERNYGIDALRIVSMFMVVLLHVLGKGGVLSHAGFLSLKYEAAMLFETAAYCAVNCYALISGYVGIDSGYRYSRIANIWLRALVYSVGITVIFWLFVPEVKVSLGTLARSFLPLVDEYWWYFSAYFVLFLVTPLLNNAVHSLTRKQAKVLLIVFFAIFSVLQTLVARVQLYTVGGYNALWLILLYVVGACIKKFDFFRNVNKRKAFAGYVAMIIITWIYEFLTKYLTHHKLLSGLPVLQWIATKVQTLSYVSPMMVVAAVCLLILFRQMHFHNWVTKVIAVLSPLTFNVYLIHTHPLVWNHVFQDLFSWITVYSTPIAILLVLACSVGVYLLCSLIDWPIERLFQMLNVKKHLASLEDKTIGKIWGKN